MRYVKEQASKDLQDFVLEWLANSDGGKESVSFMAQVVRDETYYPMPRDVHQAAEVFLSLDACTRVTIYYVHT